MTATISASKTIVVNPTARHTATLFFFHGSGGNGKDLETWLSALTSRKFTFPQIKIIYPTAPLQPYTPNGGMLSNVWFDRSAVTKSAPEIKSSVDSICKNISEIIDNEVASGIPLNRIVVGGFSMGGALAMQVAYRYKKTLAGCFAMSSFLSNDSLVYEELKNKSDENIPPLLQFHGSSDSLVPLKWGEDTHQSLKNLGVKGELFVLDNIEHELVTKEVKMLKQWLLKIVPEIP